MDRGALSTHGGRSWSRLLLLLACGLLPAVPVPPAQAQSGALDSLLDLRDQFAVEESAAVANLATYRALLQDNGGPCAALQREAAGECSGAVFRVFGNARELVHTANALTDSGPTDFSLGLDLAGLGAALRWTAGEEYSAQESLSAEFVGGQLSGLAGRIAALRGGATGFFLTGLPPGDNSLASTEGAVLPGMGASADNAPAGETYSPWGGFLTGGYGRGDKSATGNEDAFDFDGFELTAGLDYRFGDNWVAGALLGYTDRKIDFEEVGRIVVDGSIDADGVNLMAFGLYYDDNWYASLATGYTTMDFDTDRAIRYPSLNPNVDSVDTRALSSTSSHTLTTSATVGYTYNPSPALGLEPYLKLEYAETKVDGFNERDVNNDGFDLRVDSQDFHSLEEIVGLRLQYTWAPDFAVLTPYASGEYHLELETDARRIDAQYRGLQGQLVPATARFSIATDPRDKGYTVWSVGLSAVLRGGRQRVADGEIYGGLQGFVVYRTISGLQHYSQEAVSAGLRYEF